MKRIFTFLLSLIITVYVIFGSYIIAHATSIPTYAPTNSNTWIYMMELALALTGGYGLSSIEEYDNLTTSYREYLATDEGKEHFVSLVIEEGYTVEEAQDLISQDHPFCVNDPLFQTAQTYIQDHFLYYSNYLDGHITDAYGNENFLTFDNSDDFIAQFSSLPYNHIIDMSSINKFGCMVTEHYNYLGFYKAYSIFLPVNPAGPAENFIYVDTGNRLSLYNKWGFDVTHDYVRHYIFGLKNSYDTELTFYGNFPFSTNFAYDPSSVVFRNLNLPVHRSFETYQWGLDEAFSDTVVVGSGLSNIDLEDSFSSADIEWDIYKLPDAISNSLASTGTDDIAAANEAVDEVIFKVINGGKNDSEDEDDEGKLPGILPGNGSESGGDIGTDTDNGILSFLQNFYNSVVEGFNSLVNHLKNIFGGIFDIENFISKIYEQIEELLDYIFDIVTSLDILPDEIADAFPDFGIEEGFIEEILEFPEQIVNGVSGFLETIKNNVVEIKNGVLQLPQTITSAISEALAIDQAAVHDTALSFENIWYEKFPFISDVSAIIDDFNFSNEVEYPVIKVQTPNILKQFYDSEYIILFNGEDYAPYFIMVRNLVRASLWFAFGYYILNQFRVRLHIG